MKRLKQWLTESAEAWQVPLQAARWVFWFPFVGAVAVGLTRLHKPLFHFLLFEDGLVEWAQFFVYAAACVAAVGVTLRLNRLGLRRQALLYAAFAFGMFFIAGEEVAWGQRILGLVTPAALSAVNKQDDITLHNIGPVQDAFNLVMLLASAIGSVAYLANRRLEPKAPYGRVGRLLEQADYLLVPPFFASSTFMVTFVYKAIRFTLLPESGFTITRFGEWPELCLALGFFSLAYLNYRRLRLEARSASRALEVRGPSLTAAPPRGATLKKNSA